MTARQTWKYWHRQQRIIRRETLKATFDMMVWGTGVVFVEPGKDPRHIPFKELYTWPHPARKN